MACLVNSETCPFGAQRLMPSPNQCIDSEATVCAMASQYFLAPLRLSDFHINACVL